ncbi:MAG: c-type cytochrome [Pseudomonadota bacterium]
MQAVQPPVRKWSRLNHLLFLQSIYLLLFAAPLSAEFTSADSASTDSAGVYGVCATCHGSAGEGNQAMQAPRLAGMETWYLLTQMRLFREGARGTAPGDMYGMVMATTAKRADLADPVVLSSLANYVAQMQRDWPQQTIFGDAAAGEGLYRSCILCHGDRAQGIEAISGPRLLGLDDWYLRSQLQKFKSRQRGYHNSDHGGRQMQPMVSVLADDKAIDDVVTYIGSLR